MEKRYSVGLSVMLESNGNRTYFSYVRDISKVADVFQSDCLQYSSHQSKHFDFNNEEPLKRVVYDLITLCKFFGVNFEDVEKPELSETENNIIDKELRFWRY